MPGPPAALLRQAKQQVRPAILRSCRFAKQICKRVGWSGPSDRSAGLAVDLGYDARRPVTIRLRLSQQNASIW